MDVRVVVGHGQERLGRLLRDVLAGPNMPSLWTLAGAELREICDAATPARDRPLRDLAVWEEPATYVVLDDLPGREAFAGSGASFLRRLWIWEELQRSDRAVSTAVLLATADAEGLARRHAGYAVLFGGAAAVVRVPFHLTELRTIVERATARAVPASRLRPYLHPGVPVAIAAEADLRHRAGNLLGALALLEGAFAYGDLDEGEYDAIVGELRQRVTASVEPIAEYLASRGVLWGTTGGPRPPRAPALLGPRLRKVLEQAALRKGPVAAIRVLVVDNEVARGWDTVLRAVLAPASVRCVSNLREVGKGRFEGLTSGAGGEWESIDLPGFDLVLLDLRLDPKVDAAVDRDIERFGASRTRDLSGFRILKRIRESARTLPVILLTASQQWHVAEHVRRFNDVGFCSKEWYLPGPPGTEDALSSRCRDHYDAFRKAVSAAVSMRRQNARRAWAAIQEMQQMNTGAGTVVQRDPIYAHLANAYEVLAQGLDRDDRAFYVGTILHANMAAEEYLGVKQLKLLDALTQVRGPEVTYGLCVEILRDAAAHAFATEQITFFDALMALGLVLRLFGVKLDPVGIPRHPQPASLVKDWVEANLAGLRDGTVPSRVWIGARAHETIRTRGGFWEGGELPSAVREKNGSSAALTRDEIRALTKRMQLYTCAFAGPERLQLFFRYLLILALLDEQSVPLDGGLTALAVERWTAREVLSKLRAYARAEGDLELGMSANLLVVRHMPLQGSS